ncbi:aspartic peptidase domain-containing protein [Sparassis latifolia]
MSKSTTAQSMSGSDGASLADASYSGKVIKETCTMATTNGSDWNYKNQTIVVADSSNTGTIFNNGVSGVLGLGTNRNVAAASTPGSTFNAGFDDTIFGQWLDRNPSQPAFRYGMQISSPIITPKNTSSTNQPTVTPKSNAGTLHWLSPDSSAYNPNHMASMAVQPNTAANYSTSSGQPDFTVELDGWQFKSGNSASQNNQPMVATVDPYYTDMYFPLEQAQLINGIISGSVYEPSLSSLGSESGAWMVPCDAKYTFTVSIGSQSFTLDQSTLMTNSDAVCTSGIEGWTDSSITQYILGARFLSQFYVIFEINRNGTDTVTLAARSSTSHSTNVGAIVGGTIGGVAGVLLIVLGALFYFRRHRYRFSEKMDIIGEPISAVVEPYIVGGIPEAQQEQHAQFVSPPDSPGVVSPLLSSHLYHTEALPPPAYEATERSSVGDRMSTARDAKGEYVRPEPVSEGSSSSAYTSSTAPLQIASLPDQA